MVDAVVTARASAQVVGAPVFLDSMERPVRPDSVPWALLGSIVRGERTVATNPQNVRPWVVAIDPPGRARVKRDLKEWHVNVSRAQIRARATVVASVCAMQPHCTMIVTFSCVPRTLYGMLIKLWGVNVMLDLLALTARNASVREVTTR